MVHYALISQESYIHIKLGKRKYLVGETIFDSIKNGNTLEKVYRVPDNKSEAEIKSGLVEIVEKTGILNKISLGRISRKIKKMPKKPFYF
ncbi:hypothetical protein CL621_01255 [archaeon]|nr:hypothetical protein [archaeon]